MFGWMGNRRVEKLRRQVARLKVQLASVNERLAIKGREADFHAKVAAIQQARLDGLVKPEAQA